MAAGIALTIASVGTLGLFLRSAVVPFHYDRSSPSIGQTCFSVGSTTPTVGCHDFDQDATDQAFEDEMNDSNRRIGIVGAITSCTALVLGWRAWRAPWRKNTGGGRRARVLLAAACLSPVAAIPIVVAVAVVSVLVE